MLVPDAHNISFLTCSGRLHRILFQIRHGCLRLLLVVDFLDRCVPGRRVAQHRVCLMVMAAIDLDILVFNGRLVLIVYILCPDIINRL